MPIIKLPIELLKNWFLSEKRDFPWRDNPTPYEVWVSEIMLQQTQAVTVVPYFQRWMVRFPTIQALAEAPLDEVIKAWEGLGYYSRARWLHAAATDLIAHHAGVLPSSRSALEKIKGLGPYTVGAILSFAFHEKAAAVDGNVARVLSRFFCLDASHEELSVLTEKLLPNQEPWLVMEALIELGAQVCQRKPKCDRCPLQKACTAHLQNRQHEFPLKSKKINTTVLERHVAVVECDKALLLRRGEAGKLMADLYEFPYLELKRGRKSFKAIKSSLMALLGLEMEYCKPLPKTKHSFTRYRAELHSAVWKVAQKREIPSYEWVTFDRLGRLPFSSGHRRILKFYQTQES